MHAVDQSVGRNDRQVRARRLPRGGVVADSDANAPARPVDDRAKRGDQRVFGQRTFAALGASASARSARNSAPGSEAPKMLEPITSTSAPAATTSRTFSRPTPPSTSNSQPGLNSSIISRASRSFLSAIGKNDWPPKPGLTLMIKTRSDP